jgi:DNA (cytosine-5)-methyltransferase 1
MKNGEINIRCLTPLECFRLMGFEDEDYQKCKNIGMSDRQLYKQAGNSIVINVLYYLFKQFF